VLSVHSGSGSSFFFYFLLFVRVGYARRFGHTIPRYVYIARSLFACRFLGFGCFLYSSLHSYFDSHCRESGGAVAYCTCT
jgi:threonine/homoserine/homoserine lactone efflux protein